MALSTLSRWALSEWVLVSAAVCDPGWSSVCGSVHASRTPTPGRTEWDHHGSRVLDARPCPRREISPARCCARGAQSSAARPRPGPCAPSGGRAGGPQGPVSLTCCPWKAVTRFSAGAASQGPCAHPTAPTPLHCQAQRGLGAQRLGNQAEEKPGVLSGISGVCGERAAPAASAGQPPTVGFVAWAAVGVSLGGGAVWADVCVHAPSSLTRGWHISFQARS